MTQNKVSLMGKYVVLCYKSLVKRAEKVGLFWAQLYVFIQINPKLGLWKMIVCDLTFYDAQIS